MTRLGWKGVGLVGVLGCVHVLVLGASMAAVGDIEFLRPIRQFHFTAGLVLVVLGWAMRRVHGSADTLVGYGWWVAASALVPFGSLEAVLSIQLYVLVAALSLFVGWLLRSSFYREMSIWVGVAATLAIAVSALPTWAHWVALPLLGGGGIALWTRELRGGGEVAAGRAGWRAALVRIGAFLALLPVFWFQLCDLRVQRRIHELRESERAAGRPLELGAFLPSPVPDEDNAAAIAWWARGDTPSASQLAEAARRPAFRAVPVDAEFLEWYDSELPRLANAKPLLESVEQRAAAGDFRGAARDLVSYLRLVRLVEEGSTRTLEISETFAARLRLSPAVVQVLRAPETDLEFIREELRAELALADPRGALHRTLLAERNRVMTIYDRPERHSLRALYPCRHMAVITVDLVTPQLHSFELEQLVSFGERYADLCDPEHGSNRIVREQEVILFFVELMLESATLHHELGRWPEPTELQARVGTFRDPRSGTDIRVTARAGRLRFAAVHITYPWATPRPRPR